jgi:elongation factor P
MSEKIAANDIRVGNVLEFKGKLYSVLKRVHIKPGKGGAFIQAEMKSTDGTKLNHRFRSEETVEKAFIQEDDCQYLFHDNDNNITLMNLSDYSQLDVEVKLCEALVPFLTEGLIVKLQKHDGKIISVNPPETVKLEVEETEPYIKGQTAAASYKPAYLNKGLLKVMVPAFIKVGYKISIKTEDCTYIERVD